MPFITSYPSFAVEYRKPLGGVDCGTTRELLTGRLAITAAPPKTLPDFMKQMLDKRISATKALNHPFCCLILFPSLSSLSIIIDMKTSNLSRLALDGLGM
jgi:hypothetical protein